MLVPSAFLASAAGCSPIVSLLIPQSMSLPTDTIRHNALQFWHKFSADVPPPASAAHKQRCWDAPIIEVSFNSLLQSSDTKARTRLLASREKESGAWLTMAPVSSISLRMDNNTVRITTGLHLGCSLCSPHVCKNCGGQVDESGLHGLAAVGVKVAFLVTLNSTMSSKEPLQLFRSQSHWNLRGCVVYQMVYLGTPVSSIGLRMDNNTVRMATGLHRGCPLSSMDIQMVRL